MTTPILDGPGIKLSGLCIARLPYISNPARLIFPGRDAAVLRLAQTHQEGKQGPQWRLERLCPLLPTLAGTILPLHLIPTPPIPHPHFLFVFGSLFQSSRHHVCTRTDTHTESEYLLFTSFTHTQVLWPPNLNSIWHLSTWNKVSTRSISLVPSLTSRKQNPIG